MYIKTAIMAILYVSQFNGKHISGHVLTTYLIKTLLHYTEPTCTYVLYY